MATYSYDARDIAVKLGIPVAPDEIVTLEVEKNTLNLTVKAKKDTENGK